MRKTGRGRPIVGPKVETRLPQDDIQRVENIAAADGSSRADALRSLILIGLTHREKNMTALATFPAVPDSIKVVTTTSNGPQDPDQLGYSESEWHCLVTRRPRFGDARVAVYQPNTPYEPVFDLYPVAEVSDLDECEEWGELAAEAARHYVRVLSGDSSGWAELRQVMSKSEYLRSRIMADYRSRVEYQKIQKQRARDAWMYED